jgi:hypothetical protein
MPKQSPNFTGYSHEDMKRLLKAEEKRLNAKDDRWLLSHVGLLLAAVVVFVLGVLAFMAPLFL